MNNDFYHALQIVVAEAEKIERTKKKRFAWRVISQAQLLDIPLTGETYSTLSSLANLPDEFAESLTRRERRLIRML